MDALLYFDFYAEKPTLFIKRHDSYRTYIGFILSLVTTIVLVIIFIFITFCFINDTGLTVLYSKNSRGANNLDLDLSKNIFFYRVNDKSGKKIDKNIIRSYPYLTISTSEGTEYKLLKEIPCDINKLIKADKEYKELLNFDVSSYECVTFQNDENVIIQRRSSPFKNSYINLFIAKCQNDTINDINSCVSEKEIEEFIENNSIYVSLFLESAAVDHNNYTNPITKKYYQNSMSISKDFIFSYSFFWRKVEYFTRNSLILFNYLFQSTAFMLDATIKDKEFYSKNAIFHVEKTIGRIQFLMTVEYADSYIRKYITLLDSLTLLMTGFNIITKLCYILNYIFTKSYKYSSIFDPIIRGYVPKNFKETFESNIKNVTPIPSPSPSCSKLQLVDNKKKVGLSILKVNSKTVPLNKTNLDNTILDFKNLEYKQNEEINSILLDIQNKKINNNIGISDNCLFLFNKIFNSNNKKQLYLERLEKLIREELSIDYFFQEFKNIKAIIYKELNKIDFNKKNFVATDNTPFRFSINNVSSINNIV
jgi:hypothetical protein